MKTFHRHRQGKRGQTLVEYALILAFISVVAISVLISLGGSPSRDLFEDFVRAGLGAIEPLVAALVRAWALFVVASPPYGGSYGYDRNSATTAQTCSICSARNFRVDRGG